MSKTAISTRSASSTAPASILRPIVPDDTADLPYGLTRSLHVAGAGALTVVDSQGNTVTLVSGAGQYHPVRVLRVAAAGTTATGIVGLY